MVVVERNATPRKSSRNHLVTTESCCVFYRDSVCAVAAEPEMTMVCCVRQLYACKLPHYTFIAMQLVM